MARRVQVTDSTARKFLSWDDPCRKAFLQGTHRVVAPADTLAVLELLKHHLGISRVGNITGLDHIGIPVVIACRPHSRGLAVSQGKGLDLVQAKVSAVMESVESYHAERIELPLKLGSHVDLSERHAVADVSLLPMTLSSAYSEHRPMLWVEGYDLLQGEGKWIPYEVVETNYTYPLAAGPGCFQATTNGLASGNHVLEALSHALCEVIERDAISLWSRRTPEFQQQHRIDLGTVDDASAIAIFNRLDEADIDVAAWDVTSDVGVASVLATIVDCHQHVHRASYAVQGSGSHPDRTIALVRALLEAAQSRLTFISGARDDNFPDDYEQLLEPAHVLNSRRLVSGGSGTRNFCQMPHAEHETVLDDVLHTLNRLREAGMREAVVVDLTRPDIAIPVVRVVVPGLEGVSTRPDYVPMMRARGLSGSDA